MPILFNAIPLSWLNYETDKQQNDEKIVEGGSEPAKITEVHVDTNIEMNIDQGSLNILSRNLQSHRI